MTDRPALSLDLLLWWIRTSCQFCTGIFLVHITDAWATAPHVPAINVHMVYQRKAKYAVSVPGTVQPEVKALTPSVMKEVSVRRSNSSDQAVQNLQVAKSSKVYNSRTIWKKNIFAFDMLRRFWHLKTVWEIICYYCVLLCTIFVFKLNLKKNNNRKLNKPKKRAENRLIHSSTLCVTHDEWAWLKNGSFG